MTLSIFTKIMLLALLIPIAEQNLYFAGMKLTTASFASSMVNMLPAYAFLLAWILRLEKVNIRKMHSIIKIFGTMVTVGGALIMTFIKGPVLIHRNTIETTCTSTDSGDRMKGAIFLLLGCFCSAAFFNLQAITLKEYPASLTLSTLICLLGSIGGAAVAIPMEWHHPSSWAIGFDSKLLASVYSGMVCSAMAFTVIGIIMKFKGPVFVTTFCPLSTVMVTVVSIVFLSETLYLGRLIGAVMMISSLYIVLWGKSKDPTPNISNKVGDEALACDDLPIVANDAVRSSICIEVKQSQLQNPKLIV